jgi:hypothetical protein
MEEALYRQFVDRFGDKTENHGMMGPPSGVERHFKKIFVVHKIFLAKKLQ